MMKTYQVFNQSFVHGGYWDGWTLCSAAMNSEVQSDNTNELGVEI